MAGISDAVNWYGRTYPPLSEQEEKDLLLLPNAAEQIANHAVYHVIRGCVLRGKRVTAQNLPHIVDEIYLSAVDWLKTDHSVRSKEYLLEDICTRFRQVSFDGLLIDSREFVSFDAPIPGIPAGSHGGERKTYGDTIAATMQGRAGSSLCPSRVGAVSDDPKLRYDPDLDAYVRDDLIKDRKKHVTVEQKNVEPGIYSYAAEARLRDEHWLEHRSPIRSQKISDRIVAPSKAKLRRLPKRYEGQIWRPPPLGTSVLGAPAVFTGGQDPHPYDFCYNKRISHRIPPKCLACLLFAGCSSWLCGGYFTRGIKGTETCPGPFLKKDFA